MREADVDPELEEGTRGVTQEDIDQLKMEAVSAINETLFEKLQKIDQVFYRKKGLDEIKYLNSWPIWRFIEAILFYIFVGKGLNEC